MPQNAITSINVVGMLIVILGVFLYNHARINVRPLPPQYKRVLEYLSRYGIR